MKENACFFLFREPRGGCKRGEGERAARSGALGLNGVDPAGAPDTARARGGESRKQSGTAKQPFRLCEKTGGYFYLGGKYARDSHVRAGENRKKVAEDLG